MFSVAAGLAHYASGGVPSTPLFPFRPFEEASLCFAYVLTIGVIVVLMLQILIWPAKATLGWSINGCSETETEVKPQFGLRQLFYWVALIAALLSVVRTIVDLDFFWIVVTVFWLLFTGLSAIPSILIAARARPRPLLSVGLAAYLIGVSYLESEFTALCFSYGISSGWWPLWFVLIANAGTVVIVVTNVIALRLCGYAIDLPLRPRRVPTDTAAAGPASIGAAALASSRLK